MKINGCDSGWKPETFDSDGTPLHCLTFYVGRRAVGAVLIRADRSVASYVSHLPPRSFTSLADAVADVEARARIEFQNAITVGGK